MAAEKLKERICKYYTPEELVSLLTDVGSLDIDILVEQLEDMLMDNEDIIVEDMDG